jgi:hypothetical protein
VRQPKPRPKRSFKELDLALFHLQTEITGLRSSAEAFQKGRKHNLPVIIFNSLIVAFAVHFRNIHDFLYSGRAEKPPKLDDIIAEDFYQADVSWNSISHPISEGFIDDRNRLNRQIAHLTYRRLDSKIEDRTWDFEKILNEISPGIEAFFTNLPDRFHTAKNVREFDHPIWRKRIQFKTLFRRLTTKLASISRPIRGKRSAD